MYEKHTYRIRSLGRNYTIGGLIIGIVVSLVIIVIGINDNELDFSLEGLIKLHTEHSGLYYIVDLFPLVLAAIIYFVVSRLSILASKSSKQLEDQNSQIKRLSDFASVLGKGDYDAEYTPYGKNDILGNILIEMRDNTKTNLIEEKRRNWTVSGVANFGEILRNNLNDMEQLADKVIREMVTYIDGNQGGVFIVNDEDENDKHLELVACYAYERKKFIEKRMEMDEGIIGQVMLEREYIFLTDVPNNYININSGLGEANPRCILVVPLAVNEDVFGAMELASFKVLEEHEIEFVRTIATSFASTISTVKMNQNTSRFLEESRAMTEELTMKEEQMKQNAEELEATQEELSKKLFLIEEETTKTKNIVEAINKTNAAIEYDLDGNIIEVNDMFLSVTGYEREDLVGNHETFFVPDDEKGSPRYEIMWGSLSTGSFFSGEFRRIAKNGKELWLTGTYNPIYNVKGEPIKIIKYAQFTTDEKEKALDLNSKINALGQVLPVLEVKPQGAIISGNKLFIEKFKYKRLQLKKLNILDIVSDMDDSTELKDFFKSKQSIDEVIRCEVTVKSSGEDGEEFSYLANISPVLNLSNEIVKFLVLLVDIDKQKKLQAQLQKELEEERAKNSDMLDVEENESDGINDLLEEIVEELSSGTSLDKIVETMDGSMIVLSNTGEVINANKDSLSLLGVESESFLSSEIFKYFEFEDGEEDHLRQIITEGSIGQEKLRHKKGDELIEMKAVFTPVFADDQIRIIMLLMATK